MELGIPQPLTRTRVCTPPPFGSGGKGYTRWLGGRVPIPTRGHTPWYSLYVCNLWFHTKVPSCQVYFIWFPSHPCSTLVSPLILLPPFVRASPLTPPPCSSFESSPAQLYPLSSLLYLCIRPTCFPSSLSVLASLSPLISL